jgi:hypothetical protein
LNFLILPRLAVLGRIAIIFHNRFDFTSYFRNFALAAQSGVTAIRKKKETGFFCSALVFFLTLNKLLQLGEKKWNYH